MAAQEWQIDGPRVLDIGDEDERVSKLEVGIVGGRVDVVTHDDSPTARLEVTQVEGLPVRVTWDGGRLRVIHGKDWDNSNVMDMLKKTFESFSRNKVTVSISVPVETRATVATVSAAAVVSGLRSAVKVNSVSGPLTVSDLEGHVDINTVSGTVDGDELIGPATVNTVSGSVTLQGSELPEVKINTVSGDIALDLSSGSSRIRSNSVSGDVTVRAPLTGFDVEGNTASGQIVVDGRQLSRGFGGAGMQGRDRVGRLREGDGALQIKANAVSGSVVVLRSAPGTSRAGASPQDRTAGPGDKPAQPHTGSDGPQDAPQDAPQGAPGGEHPADGDLGEPFARPSEQPPPHPSDNPSDNPPDNPLDDQAGGGR